MVVVSVCGGGSRQSDTVSWHGMGKGGTGSDSVALDD